MVGKKASGRSARSLAPLPAIRVGAREAQDMGRHAAWLVIYMRCLGLVWIAQGLAQWMAVMTDEPAAILTDASPSKVTAVFFFCVLDLIAAVGLWMATSWGGVVWFATVCGQIGTLVLIPGWTAHPAALIAMDAMLVAGYIIVAWMAARDDSLA